MHATLESHRVLSDPWGMSFLYPLPVPAPSGLKIRLLPDGDEQALAVQRLPATLGRGADCDLPLVDRWVSRRHCELRLEGGEVVVRDLESRHGTLVNDRPVIEKILHSGDRLQLGLTTYQVRIDGGRN